MKNEPKWKMQTVIVDRNNLRLFKSCVGKPPLGGTVTLYGMEPFIEALRRNDK